LLLSLVLSVAAETQVRKFPYEAVIEGTAVAARSGPGRKYYTASMLSSGDRVIVHRHDPGGWYMIAPPPGSFSWIPAHQVSRTSPSTGVVQSNFVSVRVGSAAGEGSDVEQVRLSTGTQVQILGESV